MEIEAARGLVRGAAASLGADFLHQGFVEELAGLPGKYGPPDGCLLLARWAGEVAGGVALRRLEPGICEMRRVFVRPKFRGRGVGRAVSAAVIEAARRIGYERMRLDTLPALTAATTLYQSLGFRPIAPYVQNPHPEAIFLELTL